MEWSPKMGRGTVRGGGVKRGGTQIRNDGSGVGREKKMVNEAIRWVDGRERIGRTCNVLFLRPTTASSSVPCGVLGGKKVEETSDG